MIVQLPAPVTVAEVTDPAQVTAAQLFRKQYALNAAWLQSRASEIYTQHRGKYIAIAGQELHVADSAEQVLAWARTVHPDDQGGIIRYIPRDKMARIYDTVAPSVQLPY